MIGKEIIRSVNDNKLIGVKLLTEYEWDNIFSSVSQKFSDKNLPAYALWDRLNNHVGYYDDAGWIAISKIIGNNPCILFIEHEKFGINLSNGATLNIILEDTFGFVFYITDVNCDYLICFNDHNIVLACGNATQWVNEYYQNTKT